MKDFSNQLDIHKHSSSNFIMEFTTTTTSLDLFMQTQLFVHFFQLYFLCQMIYQDSFLMSFDYFPCLG